VIKLVKIRLIGITIVFQADKTEISFNVAGLQQMGKQQGVAFAVAGFFQINFFGVLRNEGMQTEFEIIKDYGVPHITETGLDGI
jgi:hypothetical protein